MYTAILVGTDGSATAAVAVQHATELAAMTGATLHVASAGSGTSAIVGDPLTAVAIMPMGDEEVTKELHDIVGQAVAPARARGVTVATHALIGSAGHALCELAERIGADLLVVGNRGMKGAVRFLGSVPNTISHNAPCSVLIVNTIEKKK